MPKRKRSRVRNLWPFDSFTKTTHYSLKHGTKSTYKPSSSYKGYSIRRTVDTYTGDVYFTVPKLDPESQFDSLADAKKFVSGWVSNPGIRRVKNTVVIIRNPAKWFR